MTHTLKISYKGIIISFLALFTFFTLPAQISDGGLPYSLKSSLLKSKSVLPTLELPELDETGLIAEDELFPTPYRYSVFEDVSIDLKKEGQLTDLPKADGKIWQYVVESEQAKSLQVYFSKYRLPRGAKLFIYNDDYSRILGAFTDMNNDADNSLMIADFEGKRIIIEYFEPNDKEFDGQVTIGALGQAYKSNKKSSSADENGFINVNCPEGADWQNEKHSVCRYTFRIGNNGYLCSGALVNNINNDGTPYFLTANHCLETDAAAASVVAYFNFENIGCDGTVRDLDLSLSGAQLMAAAAESDFTLLLFDDVPPASYQPYYAGWDASGESGEMAVGIHHPGGSPKKISLDDSAAVNHAFEIGWSGGGDTPPDSHWRVTFDKGVTSTGSSGSPLFNDSGKIIGQLHGGGDYLDFYGKLDYSWTTESITDTTLRYFLADNDKEVLTIDAYYPSSNLPDPLLFPEFKNVCDSSRVELFGYSAFHADTWEWTFLPADITYLEGTDAQSQNPIVAFNEKGGYDITLSVSNSAGNASETYIESVLAGSVISIDIEALALEDDCLCNFDSLTVIAQGAKKYDWMLTDGSEDLFQLDNDTLNPVVIKAIGTLDTTSSISLLVSGSHGKCSDEATYTLTLLKQNNDNIADAIEIFAGSNGPYSNKCATIEGEDLEGIDEPVPPFDDCVGQLSWCDEYGTGEDIVENSVWFYFIAADSGDYSLKSDGMDNQIALYEADSPEAILAGNYNLLGANDDFTLKDFNPFIQKMTLQQGLKYWIQVDGSAGGATGEFYIEMSKLEPQNANIYSPENELRYFPQPATETISIEWNAFSNKGKGFVEIFNISGSLIYRKAIDNIHNDLLKVDVSEFNSGLYFVKLNYGGLSKTFKMIK